MHRLLALFMVFQACQAPKASPPATPGDGAGGGSGDGVSQVGGDSPLPDASGSQTTGASPAPSGTSPAVLQAPSPQPSPAVSPGQGGSAAPASPAPAGSPTDQPMAVDIGNPKGTGPTTGKMKLYLADAPVDGATSFLIRPTALRFVAAEGAVDVPLQNPTTIDLLQYQAGVRDLVFEGDVPIGTYDYVGVVLDPMSPATLILAGGSEAAVLVPAVNEFLADLTNEGSPVIAGALQLSVQPGTEPDVTMHIDLRQALKATPLGLPSDLLAGAYGYDYWLNPVVAVFPSASVGSITGTGLSPLVAVACVYPGQPPAVAETSDCPGAAGSTLASGLDFKIAFLPPGAYVTRLYLTTTLYVDIPTLTNVTAGADSLLQAGGL